MSFKPLSTLVLNQSSWDYYFSLVDFPSLSQSYVYGSAKSQISNLSVVRLLLINKLGTPYAIAQILIYSYLGFVKIARINRGPLLLPPFSSSPYCDSIALDAIKSIHKYAFANRWLFIFVMPEYDCFSTSEQNIFSFCYRRRKTPWASTYLNLTPSLDDILSSFHSKWKYSLKKAITSGTIYSRIIPNSSNIDLFIRSYESFASSNNFNGIPSDFIRFLSMYKSPSSSSFKFNLYAAISPDGQYSSFLVSIYIGKTALYFLSLSDSVGRQRNDNYGLLWEAIRDSKSSNMLYFDLGGLTNNTPAGIKRFKSRLNGTSYECPGEYILSSLLPL
tara:strand:+ start:113 stop:1108 length:996 start_codon:yes stop_codon:yes gene_type:complete